ncbi:MAG: hypothetical protein WCB26_14125, partial [Pseudolabrys sp.]
VFPGQVFAGKVVSVLEATRRAQVLTSGAAVTPRSVAAASFAVRVSSTTTSSRPASPRAAPAMRQYVYRGPVETLWRGTCGH